MVTNEVTGQIYDVKKHPKDDSIVFVSTAKGLKMVTSGGSVTAISALGLMGPASPLLINPLNPLIMFAGDDSNRIMKSIDGGAHFAPSFTHSNTAKETAWMDISPSDPNYVFVSFGPKGWGTEAPKDFYFTHNASSENVVWQTAQSMDEQNQYGWVTGSLQNGWGGDTWGEFYGGPIAMHPTNREIALFFGGPGVIKKTTDAGLNWRYSNAGFTALGSPVFSIFSWDIDQIRGFATTNNDRGTYFSENNGNTFEHFRTPLYYNSDRGHGIAVGHGTTQDVIVAAVGDHSNLNNNYKGQRLVVSKDKGVKWTQVSSPDTADEYSGAMISFSPTNSNVVYAHYFRSIDGGSTWMKLSRRVNAVFWGNGDYVYSIGSSNGGNVLINRSNDRGDSWTVSYPEIPTSVTGVIQMAVSPTNPDKIYVGKRNVGVYILNGSEPPVLRNEKHGLSKGHFGGFSFLSIATDPRNANVVYVGNYTSPYGHDAQSIFRSTDGGISWQTINYNLNEVSICGLGVNPHDRYVYLSTWRNLEASSSKRIMMETSAPVKKRESP